MIKNEFKKEDKITIKIELCQLNFVVGDLDGNYQKIIEQYQLAQKNDVDLIVFSELAITGYMPQDLLLKPYFLEQVEIKIEEIKKATLMSKTAILLGCPYLIHSAQNKNNAKLEIYNSALLIEKGNVIATAHKTCLPNYGVFDENRYFKPAPTLTNIEFRGFRLVILICEDIWHLKNAFLLGDKIFDCIISINASPFTYNKAEQRLDVVRKFNLNLKKPIIYVNQIGGQDSLVFDGGSFVLNQNGDLILQMKEFAQDSQIISLIKENKQQEEFEEFDQKESEIKIITPNISQIKNNEATNYHSSSKWQKIYNATILGLRDYISKNGFKKVLLGMSGGIDSSLVATIAVDALGSDNVKLVAMPTKFNSKATMDDALDIAKNLGIKLDIINIEPAFEAFNLALEEQFLNTKTDVTEENIQSRIRGNILMALSNKFGHLLLSTGNKSELAVGYATIYGDMCGAFNPIKDIYKTEVFELAKWRNYNIPEISIYPKINLISTNIITKAPTAELRYNQKDSDSLPEYNLLDQVLYQLIEEEKSVFEILKLGFEENLVKKIVTLFYNSEYKRNQSVIGVKVSNKSFDLDRRYPITNQFKK